jgi:hypothetical protein
MSPRIKAQNTLVSAFIIEGEQMHTNVEDILKSGASIVPPRSILAVSWWLAGIENQRELAALLGVKRQRLNDSKEFELYRQLRNQRNAADISTEA